MSERRGKLGREEGVKKQANRTEKELAKKLGGFRVPASGAIEGLKGDIVTKDFLLDSKQTGKRSIVISGSQLSKANKEARQAGKKPALVLTISDLPFGTPSEWVVVSLNDFKELTE